MLSTLRAGLAIVALASSGYLVAGYFFEDEAPIRVRGASIEIEASTAGGRKWKWTLEDGDGKDSLASYSHEPDGHTDVDTKERELWVKVTTPGVSCTPANRFSGKQVLVVYSDGFAVWFKRARSGAWDSIGLGNYRTKVRPTTGLVSRTSDRGVPMLTYDRPGHIIRISGIGGPAQGECVLPSKVEDLELLICSHRDRRECK